MPRPRKDAESTGPKSTHVKVGETLADVAARVGTDEATLVKVNGLREGTPIGHGILLRTSEE